MTVSAFNVDDETAKTRRLHWRGEALRDCGHVLPSARYIFTSQQFTGCGLNGHCVDVPQGTSVSLVHDKTSLPEAAESIANFANFKKELCTFFIPPDEELVLTKRFYATVQGRSESVADFALELRTIADKIGPDISERLLKHQFTEGL